MVRARATQSIHRPTGNEVVTLGIPDADLFDGLFELTNRVTVPDEVRRELRLRSFSLAWDRHDGLPQCNLWFEFQGEGVWVRFPRPGPTLALDMLEPWLAPLQNQVIDAEDASEIMELSRPALILLLARERKLTTQLPRWPGRSRPSGYFSSLGGYPEPFATLGLCPAHSGRAPTNRLSFQVWDGGYEFMTSGRRVNWSMDIRRGLRPALLIEGIRDPAGIEEFVAELMAFAPELVEFTAGFFRDATDLLEIPPYVDVNATDGSRSPSVP